MLSLDVASVALMSILSQTGEHCSGAPAIPLGEALELWQAGVRIEQCRLIGVPAPLGLSLDGYAVLWWGRAGKLCQLLAGLVILLDIIQERNIRWLGTVIMTPPSTFARLLTESPDVQASPRLGPTERKVVARLDKGFRVLERLNFIGRLSIARQIQGTSLPEEKSLRPEVRGYSYFSLACIFLLSIWFAVAILIPAVARGFVLLGYSSNTILDIIIEILLVLMFFIGCFVVLAFLIWPLAIGVLCLIVYAIGVGLRLPVLGTIIRCVSFIALVIGFSLDLLAS